MLFLGVYLLKIWRFKDRMFILGLREHGHGTREKYDILENL